MQEKIIQMQELGYSREEIIKMTKNVPAIYSHSIETLKERIIQMQELGYSKDEVIKMTKSLPSIYGYSMDKIKEKIEFYNFIKLNFLPVTDSKNLMQSTELSYARYMFYREIGIEIDETNYNKLFINQEKFEKRYGISKKDLLTKYDYHKYLAHKRAQELGQETMTVETTKIMEELSVKELESMLNNVLKTNKKKKEELQTKIKKRDLIEKIRKAQEEGKQLDKQILEMESRKRTRDKGDMTYE